MNWKIPLFKIYWDAEDAENVIEVIESGMHWAEGRVIEKFEKKIANYIGRRHCLVFNTGTSALHALLIAYGMGSDDEVIVPSFTFIATANAPLFVGARPIFADIEEETFGLDPDDVERKITSKTKAIIPIHYAGCPCRIKELKKIAEEYNLLVIEDAAESFGAKLGNRKVGSFGHSSMLSFCQNKIITTGEGGAVATDSRKLYERLKLIRSHGRSGKKSYFSSVGSSDYVSLGYNFRMPSFAAALGTAQLKKVDNIIKMRRENAEYLTAKLNREAVEIITPNSLDDYFHVYQMYVIRIKKYRDELARHLFSKGIMTKVYFQPVHLTRFYKNKIKQTYNLVVTERIAKEVLALPIYPTLTKKEMDYIVEKIKGFLRRKK